MFFLVPHVRSSSIVLIQGAEGLISPFKEALLSQFEDKEWAINEFKITKISDDEVSIMIDAKSEEFLACAVHAAQVSGVDISGEDISEAVDRLLSNERRNESAYQAWLERNKKSPLEVSPHEFKPVFDKEYIESSMISLEHVTESENGNWFRVSSYDGAAAARALSGTAVDAFIRSKFSENPRFGKDNLYTKGEYYLLLIDVDDNFLNKKSVVSLCAVKEDEGSEVPHVAGYQNFRPSEIYKSDLDFLARKEGLAIDVEEISFEPEESDDLDTPGL